METFYWQVLEAVRNQSPNATGAVPKQIGPARLSLENLESRQLLSASSFKPDYFLIPQASTTVSGYTPAQIRTAYGFNNVSFGSTAADGRGQTIAIIDAYNDPNISGDLAAFDNQFGIAAPASLKIVNESGGTQFARYRSQPGLGRGNRARC